MDAQPRQHRLQAVVAQRKLALSPADDTARVIALMKHSIEGVVEIGQFLVRHLNVHRFHKKLHAVKLALYHNLGALPEPNFTHKFF